MGCDTLDGEEALSYFISRRLSTSIPTPPPLLLCNTQGLGLNRPHSWLLGWALLDWNLSQGMIQYWAQIEARSQSTPVNPLAMRVATGSKVD